MAPILIRPDFSKSFFLESDVSNYALGTILSQNKENERLLHVAFYSQKFTAAKTNYDIHDKNF
jgi:hypothetical protein